MTRTDARSAVAAVVDPEIQLLTIEELGILRDVRQDGGRVTVTITPTYTGCPALDVIRADIVAALRAAGHPDAKVVTELRPAWSTDDITPAGRAKLAAAGIAPPPPAGSAGAGPAAASQVVAGPSGTPTGAARSGPVPLRLSVRCPRCGAVDTEEISRFGSTACKALWRCRACAEPFEQVKAL